MSSIALSRTGKSLSYWVVELKYAPSLGCTTIILLLVVSLTPRQYTCRFLQKHVWKSNLEAV